MQEIQRRASLPASMSARASGRPSSAAPPEGRCSRNERSAGLRRTGPTLEVLLAHACQAAFSTGSKPSANPHSPVAVSVASTHSGCPIRLTRIENRRSTIPPATSSLSASCSMAVRPSRSIASQRSGSRASNARIAWSSGSFAPVRRTNSPWPFCAVTSLIAIPFREPFLRTRALLPFLLPFLRGNTLSRPGCARAPAQALHAARAAEVPPPNIAPLSGPSRRRRSPVARRR